MKMTYITGGPNSTLIIKSSIFQLLKHARVSEAALSVAPNAEVKTSGVFFLKTVIKGEASVMYEARAAARAEELR